MASSSASAPSTSETHQNTNRLSECPPSYLCSAQRLRAAPYMPLTQGGVDEAMCRVSHLRPPQWVAEEALAGLYNSLNGYCGIAVVDPSTIGLHNTRFRKDGNVHAGQQHLPLTAAAAPPSSSSSAAASLANMPSSSSHYSNGGVSSSIAMNASGAEGSEEAMEAFRRQQLAQNRSSAGHGVCYSYAKGQACSRGAACPFSHGPPQRRA